MRQFFSLMALIGFGLILNPLNAQNLIFQPEKPSPGEEVMLKYNPENSELNGIEFETTAFLMTADGPVAVEVLMAMKDGVYEGKVATNDETKAIFVTLANNDEGKRDDNNEKGYKTMMYTADKAAEGAYLAVARGYSLYSRTVGVKRNFEKATKLMMKEFKHYPASKEDMDTFSQFSYYAKKAGNEEAKAMTKARVEELMNKKTKTEKDFMLLTGLYRDLSMDDEMIANEQAHHTAFPDGEWKMAELRNSFYSEKDLAKKAEILEQYKAKYGDTENAQNTIDGFANRLANSYAKEEDWDNFSKYMEMISSNLSKAGVYNGLAWGMSGESLEKEGKNYKKAAKYSLKSLNLVKAELEDINNKPAAWTEKQWRKNTKYSYGMYADTYALLQYKLGNVEDALKYQEKACEISSWKDAVMNARYTIFHEKVNGAEATQALLSKMIMDGHANSKMKDQYKRLFIENNTVESAYEKHIASLETVASDRLKAEMMKKMIDQPAPDFTLVNLEGESVSLADMKGKVVILDFWATWCGPCIASFPGMQKAVTKFKDNDNVEFLFVDTWERGTDEAKTENASKFIKDNNYTFHVLMDTKDKAVGAYGVEGIPTKFIIGKDGNIRYKSTGFGGNDDELVNELSILIDILGGTETAGVTGAP